MNVHVVKTVPVTYHMVVEAYRKVKQGGKATGIDHESWGDFESKGVERELYVIWNRMASGSYFPQAVREIEIPKKDGKTRKLGIPTLLSYYLFTVCVRNVFKYNNKVTKI